MTPSRASARLRFKVAKFLLGVALRVDWRAIRRYVDMVALRDAEAPGSNRAMIDEALKEPT